MIPSRQRYSFVLPILLSIVAFGTVGSSKAWGRIHTIGNRFVQAHVTTDQRSGRFWISSGSHHGAQRFLYHGDKSARMITSNVVFRSDGGGNRRPQYFCNTPNNFALGGRPLTPYGDSAIFKPYDSLIVKQDTIEVIWTNLDAFRVVMRFVAETPRTEYDDGADILMEFEWSRPDWAPRRSLGIFLMLDGDNGHAQPSGEGGQGDHSSIMTSDGYFPTTGFSILYNQVSGRDSIPEFYHFGNFLYGQPLNDLYPVHRLRGISNAGAPLTTPDVFAPGNWTVFRKLSWDPTNSEYVGDVATAMNWGNLGSEGKIRTAYGTNSKAGNNLYHCRDRRLFADIRTVRVIRQPEKDGPYSPEEFYVEMWLTNTSDFPRMPLQPTIRLVTPVLSEPDQTERAFLDPSTPRDQEANIFPGHTQKLVWKLRLNRASNDTLIRLQFHFREDDTDPEGFRSMLDGCSPVISVRGAFIPPPDTLKPVIERIRNGRDRTAWWDLSTYDRHPDFGYDTGIDTIIVLQNDDDNFRYTLTPEKYRQCDVSETVAMRAEVKDTNLHARLVFRVLDCAGNASVDSILFNPRPDRFAPTIVRRDSTGSYDLANYPCNALVRTVTLVDSAHNYADSGDYGFGKIEVVTLENFNPPMITDERGGSAVRDFDKSVTLSLSVISPLENATAEIRVTDYAGNDTVLYFYYCTIPDTRSPISVHSGFPGSLRNRITVTDSAAWDRGLFEIVVIKNTNYRFIGPDGTPSDNPPVVDKGAKANQFEVEVMNECDSAELVLEFRDTYYSSNPEGHSTFDTLRYDGIPDTLAPNITIVPGPVTRTYTFNVQINDIHFVNGQLFTCDRGIETISVFHTSNFIESAAVSFINAHEAQIAFEIRDTTEIDRIDTLCITATDSAGNVSSDCAYWPSTPDGKSPVFVGRFDRGTMSISGVATDDRENDRGLASVTVRNGVNVDPTFGATNLLGKPAENVSVPVLTADEEITGEVVVRDQYGVILNLPEFAIHTVVIPFRLPVVAFDMWMPELVEAGDQFNVPIVTTREIDGDIIHSAEFDLEYRGPVRHGYVVPVSQATSMGTAVISASANRLHVRFEPESGVKIPVGDTIAFLEFKALTQWNTQSFELERIPGSFAVNDGRDTVIVVRKVPTDPLASMLTLPAPLLKMTGDSLTWVNGTCNTVLTGPSAGEKLTILQVDPQPLSRQGSTLNMVLRDVAPQGTTVELIAVDGRRVLQLPITTTGERIARYSFSLPVDIPNGAYLISVSGPTGSDSRSLLILE